MSLLFCWCFLGPLLGSVLALRTDLISEVLSEANANSTLKLKWDSLTGVHIKTRQHRHRGADDGQTFLSTSVFGFANLWRKDDGSGRQVWDLQHIRDEEIDGESVGVYYIRRHPQKDFLSQVADDGWYGEVKLKGNDDSTGQQQWYVRKVPGEFRTNSYTFQNVYWKTRRGYYEDVKGKGWKSNQMLMVNGKGNVMCLDPGICDEGPGTCDWYVAKPGDLSGTGSALNGDANTLRSDLKVVGRWKPWHTIVGAQEITMKTGMEKREGQKHTDAWSAEVFAAVSAGGMVAGVGVTASMGASVGKEMSSQFSQQLRMRTEDTFKLGIGLEREGQFLWQWVFDIVDGTEKTITKTTSFCFTSSKAVPPKCIPGHEKKGSLGQECESDKYALPVES